MIWHVVEVWGVLLAAFVVGCLIGAVLHIAVGRSRLAPAQGALSDAIGGGVDRVKGRMGVGPVWLPPRGRLKSYERPAVSAMQDRPTMATAPAANAGADAWDEIDQSVPAAILPEDDAAGIAAPEIEPADGDAASRTRIGERKTNPAPEPPSTAPQPSADDSGDVMRPASLAVPRNGVPDNLQRIRGIGERNEARLNQLGIFHFGQIAAWTPAEVRWIGQHLAFPERIERDDWVGQAIVLASGGDTGFTKSAERRRNRRHGDTGGAEPDQDMPDDDD